MFFKVVKQLYHKRNFISYIEFSHATALVFILVLNIKPAFLDSFFSMSVFLIYLYSIMLMVAGPLKSHWSPKICV